MKLSKDPITGKMRYATKVATTKREAQAPLARMVTDAQSPQARGSESTVAILFLDTRLATRRVERMVYAGHIRLHVLRILDRAGSSLNVQDLEKWYVTLRRLLDGLKRKVRRALERSLTRLGPPEAAEQNPTLTTTNPGRPDVAMMAECSRSATFEAGEGGADDDRRDCSMTRMLVPGKLRPITASGGPSDPTPPRTLRLWTQTCLSERVIETYGASQPAPRSAGSHRSGRR
jgi:hypothetical protein